MSGLMLVAHALGAEVTGSDRAVTAYLERVRAAGLDPVVGHAAANVPPDAEVVHSTAIAADNPELVVARERGQALVHRGRLLAEATALRRSIAVCGTHGKTTTASMAAHVLREAGRSPSYLIGGELRSTGSNAEWGPGDWIVVEADESDRSFLELAPDVAVVTNVELDHHATYRSLRSLEEAFRSWLEPVPRRLVWQRLALGAEPVETFGIEEGDLAARELRLVPDGARFVVEGVEVTLAVPGRHNVLNAVAAMGAVRAAGVELEEAAAALGSFTGAGRRFEWVGTGPGGAAVFDDYAHHPTEVRATLEAARTLAPRRLLACFQPHLYSRTARLRREFGHALALADGVAVLDVYPARERAEDHPGVSGWLIAAAAADASGGRPVWWAPEQAEAERLLRAELREGDLLLTLGAGDVDRLARRLVAG
jgi:UDP-N-acetylmuramate--alanine ligase